MKHRNLKTAISSLVVSLAIFLVASFLIVMIIYEGLFSRTEVYEHSLFITYEDMEKYYISREISFDSEGTEIYGRIYDNDASDRLVILSHSKDSSGENMLSEARFFLDNGYSAMVFDFTGHGQSGNTSQIGLQRSVTDLKNAVSFAEGENYHHIYLYGSGVGGYASAAVGADGETVESVAAVAAFSTVWDMTIQYATEGMGILGYIEYPVMMLYQQLVFRLDTERSAVDGINTSKGPVIVINSREDDTVIYDKAALINSAGDITAQNVTFKTLETGRHGSLMRTQAANDLLDEFNKEAYELNESYNGSVPETEIEAIYGRYDREKMSELNTELMNEVLAVFNSATASE